MSTRLFTSKALTLTLLRCHPVPIPFVSQWVPGVDDLQGTALLIAENHHTYASLLEVSRHNAAIGGGPGRHVGYGTGGQFPSAVLSTPLLFPKPDRIVYFGDVDLKGLQIPAAANTAATLADLPAVIPAVPLYELLFNVNRKRPAEQVSVNVAAEAAKWLGPLAKRACESLIAGVRFPQEAVGYELLMTRQDILNRV